MLFFFCIVLIKPAVDDCVFREKLIAITFKDAGRSVDVAKLKDHGQRLDTQFVTRGERTPPELYSIF